MVKIVEFQDRAVERLEGFRSNAAALPGLTYARYLISPTSTITKRIKGLSFALRKNKQHIMHAQHRANCIQVLSFLIKRMDVRTRECVYVNPARNIRRNIYVPEIARHTGLCDRTVTRVLGSLERAGYLLRTATPKAYKMFLSFSLLRDLNVSIMFERLVNQLKGLAKKAQRQFATNGIRAPKATSPASGKGKPISQCENSPPPTSPPPISRALAPEASLELGNSFLAQLPGRRRKRTQSG